MNKIDFKSHENIKIAVIGLGYVGLPLAVEFSKIFSVIGFDINEVRVKELNNGFDRTSEVEKDFLDSSYSIKFSTNEEDLKNIDLYIVTVPTPINENKSPDLSPLENASSLIGKYISEGDTVVYESTVYPGATEEICIPIIEKISNLKFNKDFFVGYSPERINPGDNVHKLPDIKKIVSGSTILVTDLLAEIYGVIIKAGIHKVYDIRVAEAAKVIENTQRDVNIALINELSKIFNIMGIDTKSVLDAAGTKWNFLKFEPGLVGGHCIGVDPYYLTHKAQEIGYKPEIILAGRRLNDSMGDYVASITTKAIKEKFSSLKKIKVLIMGITFKENCPDIRNTKIIDIVGSLKTQNVIVDIYDPLADANEVYDEYKIKLIDKPLIGEYQVIIIGVKHEIFKKNGLDHIVNYGVEDCLIYDLKNTFDDSRVNMRL